MSYSEKAAIVSVSSPSESDWNRLYYNDCFAMPSQSRIWADTICRSGQYRDKSRLYRFADDVEALLPLFSKGSMPAFLEIQRSPPPAWGFGGTIASAKLSAGHIAAVLEDCERLPGAAIQIRPNPLLADIWAQAAEGTAWRRLERNAHVLDLEGGFDKVWETRFPGKTRNLARKAEKLGITIEIGSSPELVTDFDRLLRLSISRWARQQHEFEWLAGLRGHFRDPRQKFLEMARLAGDMLQVAIARNGTEAVAGIIVLYGRNAHYTRGAMDKQAVGSSGANFLLQKVAIAAACERSCRHYHMGETGASASLATFKGNFGAVPNTYAEYRFERIPLMTADQKIRAVIKRAIGFQDA